MVKLVLVALVAQQCPNHLNNVVHQQLEQTPEHNRQIFIMKKKLIHYFNDF
jgi:hypothetical protein